MYPNLEAEMARKHFTRTRLASHMRINPNTIGRKLNGEAPFTLPECIQVKKILDVSMPLEELFKPQEQLA